MRQSTTEQAYERRLVKRDAETARRCAAGGFRQFGELLRGKTAELRVNDERRRNRIEGRQQHELARGQVRVQADSIASLVIEIIHLARRHLHAGEFLGERA